ncbi:MAG TPA: hypothetical protein VF215_15245 [Thermoanaerobaculia bacterium]
MKGLFMILLLSATPQPLRACTRSADHLFPTRYDLIREAKTIVTGKAIKLIPSGKYQQLMVLHVAEVLKGSVKTGELQVTVPSHWTSCDVAIRFAENRYYLLSLVISHGKASLLGDGTINREVPSLEAPWVVTVRAFVEVSRLRSYEAETRRLQTLRSDLLKPGGSAAGSVARESADHLMTPTVAKSTRDLFTIFDTSPNAGTRQQVVWALMKKANLAALVQLRRKADTKGDLNVRRSATYAITRIASARDTPLMLELLDAPSDAEASVIANWFRKHPSPDAVSRLRMRIGSGHVAKRELVFRLSELGDSETLGWARSALDSRQPEKRELASAVLAHSPLLAADELVAGLSPENLLHFIKAQRDVYAELVGRRVWKRLESIVARRDKAPDVRIALNDLLLAWRTSNPKADQLRVQLNSHWSDNELRLTTAANGRASLWNYYGAGQGDALHVLLNRLAGPGAIDCGIDPYWGDRISLFTCTVRAFEMKHPFRARFDARQGDPVYSLGIARSADGKVYFPASYARSAETSIDLSYPSSAKWDDGLCLDVFIDQEKDGQRRLRCRRFAHNDHLRQH